MAPSSTTTPAVLHARLMARARLRHLQLLVHIAELASLQKAAEAIGMSQPGATHALAEMESILGMPLFERHSRGMRPTALGHALLPPVRQAIRQVLACAETVASMGAGAAGTVRIGTIGAGLSGVLARVIPSFSSAQPEVVVDVQTVAVDDLLQLLERGEVDLLCCRAPPQLPSAMSFLPLAEDGYAVVCGPQHPMAGRRGVKLTELAAQVWLTPPPTGIAARDFHLLFDLLGGPPRTCWVSGRALLLTLAMLQQRELLSLIPRNTALQMLEAGLLAEVHCAPGLLSALPPVGLVAPADLSRCSQATRRFVEHAQQVLAAA